MKEDVVKSAESLEGALRLYVNINQRGRPWLYKLVQYAFLAALARNCSMFAQSSLVLSSFTSVSSHSPILLSFLVLLSFMSVAFLLLILSLSLPFLVSVLLHLSCIIYRYLNF